MPQGQSLLDLIEQDIFKGDLYSVVEVVIQMLNILQFYKSYGLIHRNINPNLF